MNSAYSKAVDLLARRDRSLSELGSALRRAGFAEPELNAALKRVVELGYLNEERLAGAIIRDSRLAGRGPRAAWLKVKRRGIQGWSLEQVQACWRGEADGGENPQASPELETARAFLQRRYRDAFSEKPDRKLVQRALGALLRRGFSYDIAREALSTVSGATQLPEEGGAG